jgi:YgiT-type zinc finger domain-containing protein
VRCLICREGETRPGTATVTLERGGATLVVRGVPARVCANCGEEYVDEQAAASLLGTFDAALEAGVQVDVRQYVAA